MLSETPVSVYFCYPEDCKGWLVGWLAFLMGRSNSFITHICFKVGNSVQVDFNCGGTQIYFSVYPNRPVAKILVGINKDYKVLSRVSAYEVSGIKFSWKNVLPTVFDSPVSFRPHPTKPTCCSFTLHSLLGINLHYNPDQLEVILKRLL